MLDDLRAEVCRLNRDLQRYGLVEWTAGNVSARDPGSGLVVIKPSGVLYDQMTPADMVVVDLDGRVVEGPLKPSTDTATHLFIYRHRLEVGGVVHTHSSYATAWAVAGKSIPVCMTSIASWFGGPVPLANAAPIGGEAIGVEVLRMLDRSAAVLVKGHGVFCACASAADAVRAAVRVEGVAKTAAIAMTLGEIEPLSEHDVARERGRHLTTYGQPAQRLGADREA